MPKRSGFNCQRLQRESHVHLALAQHIGLGGDGPQVFEALSLEPPEDTHETTE